MSFWNRWTISGWICVVACSGLAAYVCHTNGWYEWTQFVGSVFLLALAFPFLIMPGKVSPTSESNLPPPQPPSPSPPKQDWDSRGPSGASG